jgi:hypothetical protein
VRDITEVIYGSRICRSFARVTGRSGRHGPAAVQANGVLASRPALLRRPKRRQDASTFDRCRGEVKTCLVPDTETAPQTGYAPVNGLQMYYEVHGAGGIPLLLLHGGLFNIDLQFGQLIPGLAAGGVPGNHALLRARQDRARPGSGAALPGCAPARRSTMMRALP